MDPNNDDLIRDLDADILLGTVDPQSLYDDLARAANRVTTYSRTLHSEPRQRRIDAILTHPGCAIRLVYYDNPTSIDLRVVTLATEQPLPDDDRSEIIAQVRFHGSDPA